MYVLQTILTTGLTILSYALLVELMKYTKRIHIDGHHLHVQFLFYIFMLMSNLNTTHVENT